MPGDDPVLCGLCDKSTSVAMIARHLIEEHGLDPEEIANAPVYDMTPFQSEPIVYPEGSGYVEPGD